VKLGFYTNYSKEIVRFAHEVGFKCMELSASPGSSLNADDITDERVAEVCEDLEEHDIEVSALGFYPNFLDPGHERFGVTGAEARRYFLKVLDLAVKMNVGVVSTHAGRVPEKSVADNIPIFAEVFTEFCEEAEKRNLRIAIENCPMMDQVHMQGVNIAFSPEAWDAMFEAVPSKALGIELDPSHMVWLGIDYVQAIYDYGDRIYHVHAKDMEIRRDVLARVGIYGKLFGEINELGEHGWWRARTPGWGEVDWHKFITALIEVNYDGNIAVEFDDPVLENAGILGQYQHGSQVVEYYGEEQAGLVLCYQTLSRLVM
jgi:sugar phosphate isomerase/epimerase